MLNIDVMIDQAWGIGLDTSTIGIFVSVLELHLLRYNSAKKQYMYASNWISTNYR